MARNENKRVEAVNHLMQMDNRIDSDLNDLVKLTAQICDSPIALITLIDEDTQWFKASQDINIYCNTPEASFCNLTIQQDNVLVIEDMSVDERVANHPMVKSEPNARFYAGCNLTTRDGENAGTLCVLDVKPKQLSDMQLTALKTLARQIVNLIELNLSLKTGTEHQKQNQLQNQSIATPELKLKAMFDSFTEQYVLLGKNLEVLAFNKASAQYILNRFHKPLGIGHNFNEYNDHSNSIGFERFFQYCNEGLTGKSLKAEMPLKGENNEQRYAEISFRPVRDDANQIIGVAVNSSDITERRRHEEEIRIKTEALQQIALMQSHQLRRPVASLKGLMDLVKNDTTLVQSQYYDMIITTVNELDDKILEIVKASEQNITPDEHSQ